MHFSGLKLCGGFCACLMMYSKQRHLHHCCKWKGKLLAFRSEERDLTVTCYIVIFKVTQMKQHTMEEQHSFKTTNNCVCILCYFQNPKPKATRSFLNKRLFMPVSFPKLKCHRMFVLWIIPDLLPPVLNHSFS